jgi:hypothetical protein
MRVGKRLVIAHRTRAGAIGILACCTCAYPIEEAVTSTGHALDCQAHGMTVSLRATGEGAVPAGWTHFAKDPP